MTTEVLVPPLGQTVDTLTLLSWYKNEGDAVRQGEPLFVVETDKASLDVEAPATGILRQVMAQPGDQVKVLSAIAVVDVPGMTVPGTSQSARHVEPRAFVSPRARRLADGEGVSLAAVKATGPEDAIIERDVRAYLARREADTIGDRPGLPDASAPAISPVARRMAEEAGLDWHAFPGTGPRGQVTREDVEKRMAADKRMEPGTQPVPSSSPEFPQAPSFRPPTSSLPLSGARAVIAERMAASHTQTAPVTLTAEADATALVELRRQLAADGVAVSYNDLFLYVLAKALTEHPRLNASLDGNAIKLWQQIDIGLAVDAERGLLAPVVRDVAHRRLAQLAAETAALTERARAGKCTADELRGSTFTLTNLGMFGIDAFTPIINLPECAILGVGRIKAQPALARSESGQSVEMKIVERLMVWLSLTFDHRLVDGGPAARFLQRVVQLVERPHLLMA
ncbi:MAG: dihydrolipoamide acetyltransferase family protein [Chloroflexi bacterium]|nr:dihydrolipoamide acetyltransferase family protein [Chloroflexota bacterium]